MQRTQGMQGMQRIQRIKKIQGMWRTWGVWRVWSAWAVGGKNKHPGYEARTSTVQARGPMAELPEPAAEGLVAACLLRCRKDYFAAGAAMLHILRTSSCTSGASAAV